MQRGRRSFLLAIVVCAGSIAALPARGHEDVDVQITELTAQLQREPRNAELYFARGELHRARRQWEAALADYEQSAALNPQLAAVDLARGLLWLEAGQPERAHSALERFLATHAEHAAAHRARARALAQRGEHAAAAAEFARALALEARPQPEHYLEQARDLAADGAGDLDAAVRGLDAGIAKLGPVVTLQLYAIDLELQRRRYDAALARLDTIAAQTARQETWLARRGEILEQAGRTTAAHSAYLTGLAQLDALPSAIRGTGAMMELRKRICAALVRVGEPQAARTGYADQVTGARH